MGLFKYYPKVTYYFTKNNEMISYSNRVKEPDMAYLAVGNLISLSWMYERSRESQSFFAVNPIGFQVAAWSENNKVEFEIDPVFMVYKKATLKGMVGFHIQPIYPIVDFGSNAYTALHFVKYVYNKVDDDAKEMIMYMLKKCHEKNIFYDFTPDIDCYHSKLDFFDKEFNNVKMMQFQAWKTKQGSI